MGDTVADCVRLEDRGEFASGGAALPQGLELLFGEAIPGNVAPACY
jgi:hypothetical protein